MVVTPGNLMFRAAMTNAQRSLGHAEGGLLDLGCIVYSDGGCEDTDLRTGPADAGIFLSMLPDVSLVCDTFCMAMVPKMGH